MCMYLYTLYMHSFMLDCREQAVVLQTLLEISCPPPLSHLSWLLETGLGMLAMCIAMKYTYMYAHVSQESIKGTCIYMSCTTL